jgi:hypothetical protein
VGTSRIARGFSPPVQAWTIQIAILATLAAGCSGPTTERPSSSSTASTGNSPRPRATPSAQPVSDYASFVQALDAAGFTSGHGARTRSELFAVPDRTLFVQHGSVSTYEYPNEEALNRVRSSISPDGYSVPTKAGGVAMVDWVATPHFFRAGRLLVVYVGDKRRTLKALDLLLGPQFAGG